LFPGHAVGTVFRSKGLTALHDSRESLVCLEQTAFLATSQALQHVIARLYNQAWVGYAKRPMAGPAQVLDSLGRSTHRVALANHRIVDVHDGQGRFTFHNRRQGNRREPMPLPAHPVIRRVLLHGLPQSLQRLRHLGFLAYRGKAQALR
jgi:hypothetical protein